jgi:uncharacterized SAM-binding protein YcdF (DUF218 family)
MPREVALVPSYRALVDHVIAPAMARVLGALRFRFLPGAWLQSIGLLLCSCVDDEPSDLIVVLGGGRRERLDHGVMLLRSGVAPRLLLTSSLASEALARYGSANSYEEALRLGVPSGSVAWLPWPRNTFEEAHAVRQFTLEHGYGAITVVTEAYHSRRALSAFRRVLASSNVTVTAVCPPASQERLTRWWERRKDTEAVVSELLSLAYYRLRYKV